MPDLLRHYLELFSDKPGRTDLIEHGMICNTDEPIRTKMDPMPYSVRESIGDEIHSMLQLHVIEETISPYVSPIILVKKKDNTNRFCVDYRMFNKVTALIRNLCLGKQTYLQS